MILNREDIKHIAQLAQIDIDIKQYERIQKELSNILLLIKKLQSVDTTGIKPLYYPTSADMVVSLRLREDQVIELHSQKKRNKMLNNAPETKNHLFLVPKIIRESK